MNYITILKSRTLNFDDTERHVDTMDRSTKNKQVYKKN